MTAKLLTMFDPRTFPTAIPTSPFRTATTLTEISGSDVPPATSVAPMMNGETPSERPR